MVTEPVTGEDEVGDDGWEGTVSRRAISGVRFSSPWLQNIIGVVV